ncbi:MAG: tyrosine transporter [Verrucomicrobia bacterium]|nr:tyrosine transporter [Verrucomicrobiota bacterium]
MAKASGSVIGGMLLIAGSCIGAGMLGLPIVTGFAGFFPSLLMFFVAWVFMTATALLLVEVNGWFSKQVNLLSMSDNTLGKWGKNLCWVTYLFLFYALLVAYISGSGSLVSTMFQNSFSVKFPIWVGSLFFVILFGWVVYLGTRRVDHVNRGLMFGKIGFFILLIIVGVHFLRPGLLLRTEPKYAFSALPLLVIAFGFHNMIPSLTAYLNGDLKRVRITIIGGSLMAFVIYLIWEILVLGIVPLWGPNGLIASLRHDQEASQAIAAIVRSPAISIFSQGLAFFAILTSFLAQALSLVHFLADGFKINYKKQESVGLCILALAPPLILSLIYPQLFFKALNFAGGICAVVLFGILPVLMVWIGRYRNQTSSGYQVPGGKSTLIGVLVVAVFIFILQLASMLGYHFVPDPHSLPRGM